MKPIFGLHIPLIFLALNYLIIMLVVAKQSFKRLHRHAIVAFPHSLFQFIQLLHAARLASNASHEVNFVCKIGGEACNRVTCDSYFVFSTILLLEVLTHAQEVDSLSLHRQHRL